MTLTDVDLSIAAAEAGAAVVRARFGTPLTRIAKAADDFATTVDIEAEHTIRAVLHDARPDDAVEGEEHGLTGPEHADRTWLVDPLCGTLNFAAGTPLVAVNVALRVGDAIAAAASADPFRPEVFWTDGERAWSRSAGTDTPLVPSAESRLVDVNIDPPFGDVGLRLLGQADFRARFRARVTSTTLAVAWVAAGRRAAYVTDGDLRDSVHFAPGIALCRAAGCVVTGGHGQPLHTGAGGLLVAADEVTHAALLAAVEASRPD